MPSIYTHHKFGDDVFKSLDLTISNIIKEERVLYNIFNQSFDNFFYYDFFKIWNKKKVNIGNLGHTKNTNLYFENIIKYIKNNNLEDNKQLLAYLFGSINHYVLDSIFHPYVIYKTGIYNSKNKETYKYNALHTKFEFMLDNFFYHCDTNLDYKNYKIYKEILPKYSFEENFITAINCIYKETFSINDAGKILKNTYICERFVFKYILRDTMYLKKILYNLVDQITSNKVKHIKYNRTSLAFNNPLILNLKREKWLNPVTKEAYNCSLLDLYEEAIVRSKKLIERANSVVNNSCSLESFLIEIGNKSYVTGQSLESKQALKYFEF